MRVRNTTERSRQVVSCKQESKVQIIVSINPFLCNLSSKIKNGHIYLHYRGPFNNNNNKRTLH